ncbi:hypothetical protein VTL71DRAFT_8502 [Oculimacula yallundae]|uniref:Uncharacterized protein n=1 Tax=Oculimacula yallundae TaxID=86028 RepID=A0ABR4CZA8_9HELO
MANSSEDQQSDQPSQFSPSLFDFEAFQAQVAAEELLQLTAYDGVGSDYQTVNYDNLDLNPTIPYPLEPEPQIQSITAPIFDWDRRIQADPLPEPPVPKNSIPMSTVKRDGVYRERPLLQPSILDHLIQPSMLKQPNPENHRSSYVPIMVTAPVNQTPWAPNASKALPPNHSYYPAAITRPPSVAPQSSGPSRPASHTPEGSFLNPILNSFTCPSTPLRIIDSYKFPFEDALQRALEVEVERQNKIAARQDLAASYQADLKRRRESNEALQAKYDSLAQELPAPHTPAPTPAGDGSKTPRNKRPINISNTDPKKWYQPLAMRPDSWGSINPDTQECTFSYTKHGELSQQVFSIIQISEYISSHRATMWIQTVPADSGRRYPSKTSDKCRFACCPDPKRTIRKGDFRVAFDEHPTNTHKDPFHNAAYTHLFCLEKNLDFPQICKNFDVRPDTRVLKEGKNKMAVTRDHKSMADIVNTFIKDSVSWQFFNDEGRRPKAYYEFTLCSQLTREHLNKQSKHLQTVREARGGNTIDIHQNNLDVYVAGQEEKKERLEVKEVMRRMKRKVREESEESGRETGQKRKYKKRAKPEESDESGLDDDILQRGLKSPSSSPASLFRPQLSEAKSRTTSSSPSSKRRCSTAPSEEAGERDHKRLRNGRRIPSV